jgi:dTDP-4-amino-4,6-dideoxygalactose transaminase
MDDQAAVLIEAEAVSDEIVARQRIAAVIPRRSPIATVPTISHGTTSVWAQYTPRLAGRRRDALAAALKRQGIPTAIYYPIPLHRQAPYEHFPVAEGGAPVSERLAEEVISLPMHAYLDATTQERIIEAVRSALEG